MFSKARDFLVASQNADGSWTFAEESSPSDTARAALCLAVLKQIEANGQSSTTATQAVAKAQTFLEAKRSGGSYGGTLDNAIAYRALLHVKQPAELQETLAALTNGQLADGSWDNDIYTTAAALLALAAVQPPATGDLPDLSIDATGIEFAPSGAQPGTPVTITATVFNNGTAEAQNVSVEFFNKDPRLGGTAIGTAQSIDSIPAAGSAQASVTFDTAGLFEPQYIVVFVDRGNSVKESDETNNATAKYLPLSGAPDLAIGATDISFSTDSPAAFERLEITAHVANLGGALDSGFVVRFLDGTAKLADITLGGVGAGQSATATLITGLTAGAHSITVQVDPEGALTQETERSNNVATANVSVAAPPVSPADLLVESIVSDPAMPLDSETVALTVSVVNQGGTAVDQPFSVTLDDGADTAAAFSVPSLAAGQRAVLTVQGTFLAGEHQLVAVADPGKLIAESDETNNSRSLTLKVVENATPADLVFTRFDVAPAELSEGDTARVSAEIKNVGSTAAVVVVRLFDNGEPLGTDLSAGTLAGGQSATLQWVTDFKAGTRTLTAVADPDSVVAEGDEANNTASATVTVKASTGVPDLEVTASGISFSNPAPVAFETFDITAQVKNVGSNLADNVAVRFLDGAETLATVTLGGIGVGQTGTARLRGGLTEGSHTITVVADPDSALVGETNRNNNQADKAITVAAPPASPADLVVQSLVLEPSSPVADAPVALKTTVINQGGTAAGAFALRLSVDGTAVHSFAMTGLAAGQKAELTLSTALDAGDRLLEATADPDSAVAESDESNNSKSVSLSVPSVATPPDLTITSLAVSPSSPAAGDVVTVTVGYANLGTTGARDVALKLFNGASQVGGTCTTPTLAGGQRGTLQIETTLDAGNLTLTAKIDPSNTVAESDEDNNAASVQVVVQSVPRPDLAVAAADIAFSNGSPVPGETIQVTAVVHNDGSEPSAASELLLTEGDPFAGGTVLIGEVAVPAIAAGATATVSSDYVIPSEGKHVVYAFADSKQLIQESNEKNNLASKALSTAPLPDLMLEASSLTLSHSDLALGNIIKLSAVVNNIGAAESPACEVSFYDKTALGDTYLIQRQSLGKIPSGSVVAVSSLWQALPGAHTIVMEIDSGDVVVESDEGNNVVEKEVLITAPEMILATMSQDSSGNLTATSSFAAYAQVVIQVTQGYGDVVLELQLTDPEGESQLISPQGAPYTFNTSNKAPGWYEITATAIDSQTGVVIASSSSSIEIVPTAKLASISASAHPRRTYVLNTEDVKLTAELVNGSNVAFSCDLAYEGCDADSAVVEGGVVPVTLDPGQRFTTVDLASFSHTFNTAGEFVLRVTAQQGGEVLDKSLDAIKILPLPSASVTPDSINIELPFNAAVGQTLDIATDSQAGASKLDIVFLYDVSGSFGDDIYAFRSQASSLMDAICADFADVQFGVATFCDYPFNPWGDGGDEAFHLYQSLTSDKQQVTNVINSIYTTSGFDEPEAQLEGIYQTTTGLGRDVNGDGDYDDTGDIAPTSMGWRPGSKRIILFSTDAPFHVKGEGSYPGPSFEETIQALQDNAVSVVGLLPTMLYNSAAETDTRKIVAGSGAVGINKEPLVFRYDTTGTSIAKTMLDALAVSVNLLEVTVQPVDDANGFFQNITPTPSYIYAGKPSALKLMFKGSVPPTFGNQYFDFNLDLVANGKVVIASIPTHVTVPATIPLHVETDKEQYFADEPVNIKVGYTLSSNGTKTLSSAADWAECSLNMLSDTDMPGSLTLALASIDPSRNLVVNGDVETGDTSGWTVNGVSAANWYLINGAYSLCCYSWGTTYYAYQEISVPDNALSAQLSLTDQLVWAWSGSYKIQIRDSTDAVLKTLFETTATSFPQTRRSFDLSEFKGQTVRIYFGMGGMEAMYVVDDVRLDVVTGSYVPGGKARYVLDAGKTVIWGQLNYDALVPEETVVSFRARGADSEALLSDATFCAPITNSGAAIPSTPSQFLELEVSLAASTTSLTPELKSLEATYTDISGNDYRLELTITDSSGTVVKSFAPVTPELDRGASPSYNFVFDSTGCLAGDYQAVGKLYDGAEVVAAGNDAFKIVSASVESSVDGSVTADKVKYIANETATITAKTFNKSLNLPPQKA